MAVVSLNKEKLIVPSQMVGLKKQDGKRIIKIFVSDSSINDNGDRFDKEALDSIIQTAKGQPLIIPPFLDHPQVPNHSHNPQEHIRMIREAAKPYEGGIIYDLERNSSIENPGYNGLVELTSKFAINLFDEGILPRFYSISIYKTNPKEPNNEIKSAVVNNICAVRNPAYGSKARILGMCVGDRESCKSELVESSTASTGWSNTQTTMNFTVPYDDRKIEGKCDTMRSVESLSEADSFRFDNNLLIDAQVNSSVMSTMADPGTTNSETTITYPESKRVVKKDGQGNIISETKMDEQKKEEATPTEVKTKEEKTVEKEVKKISEEKKPEEKEEGEGEGEGGKQTKIEQEKKKEEQPQQEQNQNQNSNSDRVGTLEQQMRQLSNKVDKQDKTIKWYRKDMISSAINNAKWLKPEQKEERINRYDEMDLHGEDLKLALTDAFGEQMAVARGLTNPERKSSEQNYHEDTFTNASTNTTQTKPNDKLTLDLLRRKQ